MSSIRRKILGAFEVLAVFLLLFLGLGCNSGLDASRTSAEGEGSDLRDPAVIAEMAIYSAIVSDLLEADELQEDCQDLSSNKILLRGKWPAIELVNHNALSVECSDDFTKQGRLKIALYDEERCLLNANKTEWNEAHLVQGPILIHVFHQGSYSDGVTRRGQTNVYYDYIHKSGKWEVRFNGAISR
jgi:hypothetical protein